MEPIYLLDLAGRRAEWLGVRQTAVAGNIANADTPGYRARDVEPFADELDRTRLAMAATSDAHMGGDARGAHRTEERRDTWAVTASGNSVSLEEQMITSSGLAREFGLNRAIVRAFYRMMLTGVRSGQ